jgi:MFS family permease
VTRLLELLIPSRLGGRFRSLCYSSWLANLGDGIALAAGPLLVASQTHDPFLVALAGLLQRLPFLLLGLYAGVLADRLNRQAIIVIGDLLRGIVLVALSAMIFTGQVNIAVVLVVMFLLGLAETFVDTTSSTLLPMLVADKADYGVANSRLMGGFLTANQLVGPPLGAFLFAAGMWLPFVAQAVLVGLGARIIAGIAMPAVLRSEEERTTVRRDVRAGLAWVWHHKNVRTLALTIFVFNVTWAAPWAVLVLYATRHLDMGEIGFGLLTTAAAVGGLIGTASYGFIERHVPLATVMRTCLLLEVFMHLALALNTHAWLALVILFGFGIYAFIWGTVSHSVRQRAVPAEFQGRVSSVNMLAVVGGMVIGGFLGGVIAGIWGIVAPFWFAFIGSAITLALIWRELAHIAHADELTVELDQAAESPRT